MGCKNNEKVSARQSEAIAGEHPAQTHAETNYGDALRNLRLLTRRAYGALLHRYLEYTTSEAVSDADAPPSPVSSPNPPSPVAFISAMQSLISQVSEAANAEPHDRYTNTMMSQAWQEVARMVINPLLIQDQGEYDPSPYCQVLSNIAAKALTIEVTHLRQLPPSFRNELGHVVSTSPLLSSVFFTCGGLADAFPRIVYTAAHAHNQSEDPAEREAIADAVADLLTMLYKQDQKWPMMDTLDAVLESGLEEEGGIFGRFWQKAIDFGGSATPTPTEIIDTLPACYLLRLLDKRSKIEPKLRKTMIGEITKRVVRDISGEAGAGVIYRIILAAQNESENYAGEDERDAWLLAGLLERGQLGEDVIQQVADALLKAWKQVRSSPQHSPERIAAAASGLYVLGKLLSSATQEASVQRMNAHDLMKYGAAFLEMWREVAEDKDGLTTTTLSVANEVMDDFPHVLRQWRDGHCRDERGRFTSCPRKYRRLVRQSLDTLGGYIHEIVSESEERDWTGDERGSAFSITVETIFGIIRTGILDEEERRHIAVQLLEDSSKVLMRSMTADEPYTLAHPLAIERAKAFMLGLLRLYEDGILEPDDVFEGTRIQALLPPLLGWMMGWFEDHPDKFTNERARTIAELVASYRRLPLLDEEESAGGLFVRERVIEETLRQMRTVLDRNWVQEGGANSNDYNIQAMRSILTAAPVSLPSLRAWNEAVKKAMDSLTSPRRKYGEKIQWVQLLGEFVVALPAYEQTTRDDAYDKLLNEALGLKERVVSALRDIARISPQESSALAPHFYEAEAVRALSNAIGAGTIKAADEDVEAIADLITKASFTYRVRRKDKDGLRVSKAMRGFTEEQRRVFIDRLKDAFALSFASTDVSAPERTSSIIEALGEIAGENIAQGGGTEAANGLVELLRQTHRTYKSEPKESALSSRAIQVHDTILRELSKVAVKVADNTEKNGGVRYFVGQQSLSSFILQEVERRGGERESVNTEVTRTLGDLLTLFPRDSHEYRTALALVDNLAIAAGLNRRWTVENIASEILERQARLEMEESKRHAHTGGKEQR